MQRPTTLEALIADAKIRRPYWYLLPRVGGPDPRTLPIEDFSRHPYDPHWNAWCFPDKASRDRMAALYPAG